MSEKTSPSEDASNERPGSEKAPGKKAERARDFVALHQTGVLSTISAGHQGYPFGSVVPYDVDDAGRIVIFISRLAEHFRNLDADSRASVIVLEQSAHLDPQPFGRATLIGTFLRVPDIELEQCRERYFARFPNASSRGLAHDFFFYRLAPERVRWIGGFGDIRWIDGEHYQASAHDPVCYAGASILSHMNIDHADAVGELARAATAVEPEEKIFLMSGISSRDITVTLLADGRATPYRRITILFDAPLTQPSDARSAIIELLRKVRSGAPLASRPAEH